MTDFMSDPHRPYLICCVACRKPLWLQKILSHSQNRVVSTETKPVGDNKEKFSNRIHDCPLCGREFFHRTKSGDQMYLLVDSETGESRLV